MRNPSGFICCFLSALLLMLGGGCKHILNSSSSDSISPFVPQGWELVSEEDSGSLQSFHKKGQELQRFNEGSESSSSSDVPSLELNNPTTSTTGSTTDTPFSGMSGAQYTYQIDLGTIDTITLKLSAKTAITKGEIQREFKFLKNYIVRVWVFADEASSPVWQADAQSPDGYINMSGRNWATYQCGVVVSLASEDSSSISASGGAEFSVPSVIEVASTGSKEHRSSKLEQHMFIRNAPGVITESKNLPQGSTRGPTSEEIRKKCTEFAKDPTVKASMDADIAIRAKNWRYVNGNTTCLDDKDCSGWHAEVLGAVRAWTNPRCMRIAVSKEDKSYYACRLRSIKGGDCTLPDVGRGPFEFPCDQGLSCQPVTTGALWWKRVRGECK